MSISGDQAETVEVLGVPVTCLDSYRHAVATVMARVARRDSTVLVAINPEKIQRARQEAALREFLQQADLRICDGVGAQLAVRLLHGRRIARITGIQLFFELIAAAAEKQLGVFLLGARAESNDGACRRLMAKHPQLRIVGTQDGYFSDETAVVEPINDSGAELLFVAMGSPKQEEWIARHRSSLRVPFCMGVGGTFDVVSGRAAWAPAICRKTGTEFLYRLVREPKRWRRQLELPAFAWEILKEKMGLRRP